MKQLALLTITLMCFAGCGPSTMTLAISSNGISYDMPFQKQIAPDPGIISNSADKTPHTGFTFIGERITIKELDGNLNVNGKDFGAVKSGDKVHIDNDGKVSINGTPRTPK